METRFQPPKTDTPIEPSWLGPPPAPSSEIRHLNADRTDNRIENLDWGTASDNWSDRRALGNGIHEDHHAAKITMTDADAIRTSSLSQRKIAAMYGVSQSLVCDIRKGRIWRKAPAATGRNIALPDSPRLWVREAWRTEARYDELRSPDFLPPNLARDMGQRVPLVSYEANYTQEPNDGCRGRSRAAIHMPRWASRLTLIVEDVRVERLQEISEADARAEGCRGRLGPNPDFPDEWDPSPQEEFSDLWRSLHGPDAWAANPFVAVISFRVIRANIDSKEARA